MVDPASVKPSSRRECDASGHRLNPLTKGKKKNEGKITNDTKIPVTESGLDGLVPELQCKETYDPGPALFKFKTK